MVLSEALDAVVVLHAQRRFKQISVIEVNGLSFTWIPKLCLDARRKPTGLFCFFFFFWCKKVWESCARVLEFVLVCRVCCNVGGDGHCAQQGQYCRGLYRYAWLSNRMLNEGVMNEAKSAVPTPSYRHRKQSLACFEIMALMFRVCGVFLLKLWLNSCAKDWQV